jgi:GxxExxY protein
MALMKEINEKVYKVIGSCMEVHRTLGPGYPVEFYRKALEVELPQKSLAFEAGKSVQVMYKEAQVGSMEIDFVVDKAVVLSLRSQEMLMDHEVQQTLRCLQLTGCTIGVLVNFGLVKIQYKRILPGQQQKDVRKDAMRPIGYREIGKTREGNPIR